MAYQVVQAVMRSTIRPIGRRVVAITLAEHANPDGASVFPGMQWLEIETALNPRSVQRHISALIDDDAVLIQVARGHEGQRAAFRFDMDRLAELQDPRVAALKRVTRASGTQKREGDAGVARGGQQSRERVTPVSREGDAGVTPSVMTHPGTTLEPPSGSAAEGEEREGNGQPKGKRPGDPFELALAYQLLHHERPPMAMLTKLTQDQRRNLAEMRSA